MLATILIYGIIQTFMYTLNALGFSLLFGVARVLNLSHGMIAIVACYVTYWTISSLSLPMGISLALGIIGAILVSLVVYFCLIKRLRDTLTSLLLVTAGAGMAIQAMIILIIGPVSKSVPCIVKGSISILGVSVSNHQIIAVIIGITLTFLVWFFIQRTKFGIAIRAVSQDRDVACMYGIDAEKALAVVMIIAAGLAAVSGLLLVPMVGGVVPEIGWELMVSAFTVTVLAGIGGNILGVVIAATIIAYAELITGMIISPMLKEVATFVILIATLMLKPSGIFGRGIIQ